MYGNYCCWCYDCCPGPTGPTGPRGATGPTGATGPAGITAYGGRYNTGAQTLVLQAGVPTVVSFNTEMPSQNIIGSPTSLTITQSGNYEISYRIIGTPSQGNTVRLDVRANGVAINGASETHVLATGTENVYTVSTIANLTPGTVLDLVATSINAAIVLTLGGGVNATLMVRKLGN